MYGCRLSECEIMPDHVHLFVSVVQLNKFNLSKLIQHIKGWSSYRIRKRNSWMQRYKHYWGGSYFCESIGNISQNTIRKYIKNQKINVKSTYKYKHLIKSNQSKQESSIIRSVNEKEEKKETKKKATHKALLFTNQTKQHLLPPLKNSNTKSKRDFQLRYFCKTPVLHPG